MKTDWKTVRLGDVCEIITGSTPSTKNEQYYSSKDIPFIKPSDLPAKFFSEINSSEFYISEVARPVSRIIPENSVLVSCIGIIGKIGISKREVAFNQQINALIPNINQIDYKYLASAILNRRKYISEKANAAVVPIINKTEFSNLEIPLPPLETQKQIAALLDKCTAIIQKHKTMLEKYDLLIKSRFIEMFGDEPTKNKKWKVEKLGNLGTCKNGMNFNYIDNGFEINCLGVGDFKDYAIISNCEALPVISLNDQPSEEYLLKDNDIVFVRSNGNKELVGRSVLVHPNVLTTFSGFCIRFRLIADTVNSIFLLQFLKMPNTRKKMAGRGANIQNLNQQILSELKIPIPPLELQNDFAAFVQQIDKSKLALQKSLEKTETLYKTLMQEYFG